MDDLDTVSRLDAPSGAAAVDGDAGAPVPPVRTTPGLRPAMVVLGLAVLLVAGLVVAGVLSGQGPGSRDTPPKALGPVAGTSLRAVSAVGALGPIEHPGQPPNNVLRALVLPAGASRVATADNTGSDGYDEQVTFSSPATEAELLAFYAREFPRAGWHVESTGAPQGVPGGQQVLGQLAGSDGYYWEAGAVISPTSFPVGGPPAGVTRFTLRLIQVGDDD